MEWDRVSEPGQIWRVRVQLQDRPGTLSELTTRLSSSHCNLLAVTVLPASVASSVTGDVIDDFVLRAPPEMTAGELRSIVNADGVQCCGLTPASINALVDPETALLRVAKATISGTITTVEAVRRILGAESATAHGPRGTSGEWQIVGTGHKVTVTLTARSAATFERQWSPFLDGELARVGALLDLIGEQVPSDPDPVVPPQAPAADSTPTQPTVAQPRIRQLSSLDVQFLNAETPTTVIHVGGLTILDASELPDGMLTAPALRAVIRSRLHLVAPLRWSLKQVPLGVDLPYWDDSAEVDLEYHVRSHDLRHEGDGDTSVAALHRLVGRLDATPLDRARPLWEAYLISGLADGRQALYTKVHHAVIDGVSGAEVMGAVMDLTAESFKVPPPTTQGPEFVAPRGIRMATHGARHAIVAPSTLARAARTVLPHLADVPGVTSLPGVSRFDSFRRNFVKNVARDQRARPGTPPPTPFNKRITARRSIATAQVSLADVKKAKNAFGCTVNDVVMALCTSALRQWLIDHNALPDKPLVGSMPVSVRTREQLGTAGNQIAFMPTVLPTHDNDPHRRLTELMSNIAASKQRFADAPPTLLHHATAALPQLFNGVVSRAVFATAGAIAPPCNLLISNVPGPQIPLYVGGAKVVANYPISVISDFTGGLNITVMSYDGHLDFGIVTCPDPIPDVEVFETYLIDAMAEILTMVDATQPADSTSSTRA